MVLVLVSTTRCTTTSIRNIIISSSSSSSSSFLIDTPPRSSSSSSSSCICQRICMLGPFHGDIAVPSVTRCRCCRCCCCCGHRFYIAIHQVSLLSHAACAIASAHLVLVVVSTVATPGEWQCKIRTCGVRRLAVANGPNIFQCFLFVKSFDTRLHCRTCENPCFFPNVRTKNI